MQKRIITCDDDEQIDVEVWAWDQANNPYAVQYDGSIGGPNGAKSETTITVVNMSDVCGSGLQDPASTSGIQSKVDPILYQNEIARLDSQ